MAKPAKKYKKLIGAFWAAVLCLFVGYLATLIFHKPGPAMVGAVACVIPFGARAKSYRHAAVRGGILGLLSGMGMWTAMLELPEYRGVEYHIIAQRLGIFVLAIVAMCAIVAALFYHTAQKRRQEQQ